MAAAVPDNGTGGGIVLARATGKGKSRLGWRLRNGAATLTRNNKKKEAKLRRLAKECGFEFVRMQAVPA